MHQRPKGSEPIIEACNQANESSRIRLFEQQMNQVTVGLSGEDKALVETKFDELFWMLSRLPSDLLLKLQQYAIARLGDNCPRL